MVSINKDTNNILEKMEKIRESINNIKIEFDNHIIVYTVSIGIVKKDENENIDSVLERADKELYKAKDNGRNNIKFRF